jgi:PKD repeat protein
MKFRLTLLVLLVPAVLFAGEIFRTFPLNRPFSSRIYTVTPGQIRSGSVTDLVIRGENLLPRNEWHAMGIRVLNEQYVDANTMILKVFASGNPGLRKLAVNGSAEVTLEVLSTGDIFHDDFEAANLLQWVVSRGVWSIDQGQAMVSTGNGKLFAAMENTDNVRIDFDLTFNSGNQAGVYFQYRDKNNNRLLYVDAAHSRVVIRDRFNGKNGVSLSFPLTNAVGTPHHFTLTTTNNVADLLVDGAAVFSKDLKTIFTGRLALYSKKATAHFDNINVYRDSAANAIPVADFHASSVSQDVSLSASSSTDPDGSIIDYSWSFGDGATGSGVSPSHHYAAGGTYSVLLSVTDNLGATTAIVKQVTLTVPSTDKEMIQQVVRHFFELFDDVEHLTGEQICVDFSRDPNCPARQKQIDDINEGKKVVVYNEVFYLSDVSVKFESTTQAYPVKIHNLFKYQMKGDPVIHQTDGWHIYHVQKEGDGKWHQCKYYFEAVSQS